MITISARRRAGLRPPEALDRPAELPENGFNDIEQDTTVQCFATNASTVSLNARGFSNSSP
jgi:hypothetical protein